MTPIVNNGQSIEVFGKSGSRYGGRMFDKQSEGGFEVGKAIVCLSNSNYDSGMWKHKMNSIFHTDNIGESLAAFRNRDDISHLIVIPEGNYELKKSDWVDDLIRNYLHS